jgi:quercetin dioxygenase-like cupin family protein
MFGGEGRKGRRSRQCDLGGSSFAGHRGDGVATGREPMTISTRFALTLVATVFALGAGSVLAENAVTADPDHYKVEFENDSVRVVRVKYGPGEKSVMHDHDDYVVVYLTDVEGKFTMPDGSTEKATGKAGGADFRKAHTHLPENTGTRPFEVILFEIKK